MVTTNSPPSFSPPQKKILTDNFVSVATEAVKSISVAAKSVIQNRMPEGEVYGQYLGKSLAALQNKRNKLDARRRIDEIRS